MEDVSVKAEYSKSNRSVCKICHKKIGKSSLRLAVIDTVSQHQIQLTILCVYQYVPFDCNRPWKTMAVMPLHVVAQFEVINN